MKFQVIHLKEHYPFLGQGGKDPMLTTYIQDPYTYTTDMPRKRPGILLCPGGSYKTVSPREGEPIALRLLAMGYHVFMLAYSVKPYHFPAQLQEVAAAMELIHANADAWNVDIEKIAIMGFSAGGHLAAHYTNCYDCDQVRQVLPDSKPVQATILCYPVITSDENFMHRNSFINLSGCDKPLDPKTIEKFSCEKLVTPRTPPTFIWHTAQDELVSVNNSMLYAQALANCHIPFSLHIYPYGCHGLATADGETNKNVSPGSELAQSWLPELERWLHKIFE